MKPVIGMVIALIIGIAAGFGGSVLIKKPAGSGTTTTATTAADDGQVLFVLDNKEYRAADLPAEIQSDLYDLHHESHERIQANLEQFALRLSLARESNKDVTLDNLPQFEDLVQAPEPADSEVQAVFDANKSRLPPNTTFEQIKGDIVRYIKNQKISETLRAKANEFKAQNRYKFVMAPPQAPLVNIDISAYPSRGPGNSSHVLVEVADYLCPHCQQVQTEVEAVLAEMGMKFKFVPVSYSLRADSLSGALARGAFCARQQGDDKFWKYHEEAFKTAKGKAWKLTDPESKEAVTEVVNAAALDAAKFDTCLASADAKTWLEKSQANMRKAGVSGTPVFFLNGRRLHVGHGGETLKQALEAGLNSSTH